MKEKTSLGKWGIYNYLGHEVTELILPDKTDHDTVLAFYASSVCITLNYLLKAGYTAKLKESVKYTYS